MQASTPLEGLFQMNNRGKILLRGVRALLGENFAFQNRPLDVLIEDGCIAAIELAGTVPHADTVIELDRHLLVPGLINGHFHSHEHFHRGRIENMPLELWMHYMRAPLSVALTPRQIYLRTMIGAIECLCTGATTVVDDLVLGASVNRDNLAAAFQAYEDVGIRALVGFAMLDRPIVDNFPFVADILPPELLAQLRALPYPTPEQYLDLCRELARDRHPSTHRVGILVAPSAPQRCTEGFLTACRRLADDCDLPTIIHVQETRLQVVTGQVFYGEPMVEHLARVGFLKPRTSLIHATWLNPREVAHLADSGATAQHNPWSNLMLGSGLQPVRALLDAGVNVSLGSDGSCSTVSVNMLNVLGSAAALSKIGADDYSKWLSARDALAAGTLGGAKALGFEGQLGVIKLGANADLVAYRLDTSTFTPLNDPVKQLVYAERGKDLDFAMVAGDIVMRDGELTRIDESRLLEEIGTEHEKLVPFFREAERRVAHVNEHYKKIYERCLSEKIAEDTYPARLHLTSASGK